MRLARVGATGEEIPAIAGDDGRWYDLRPLIDDIEPALLSDRRRLAHLAAAVATEKLPLLAPERFGPPLSGIGKIVCIGLNYHDHAAETGAAVPSEPIIFMKAPDTVVGPDDGALIPRASLKTDYEVELAVVIGAQARYLTSPEDARGCVAGYAISNDLSERSFQLERGGQWDKGKNCETFNPLGPWLVTDDEIADPHALGMRLWVNGALRQDGSTKDMIFRIEYLVWYLSQFLVLNPGDIVNTGTPAGVALGRADKPYLRAGDVVEVEIDGLGRQRHTLGAA